MNRKSINWQQVLGFCCLVALVIVFTGSVAMSQGLSLPIPTATPSPLSNPAVSPTPSPIPSPTPTPIPLAEVVTQTETTSTTLRNIEADLAADQITLTVDQELPTLKQKIDAQLAENPTVLGSRPSFETLRNLELEWKGLGENLPIWKRDLTTLATQLEKESGQLAEVNKTWELTLELAQTQTQTQTQIQTGTSLPTVQQPEAVVTAAPPEILQRIQTTLAAIKKTREAVEQRRVQVLTQQSQVAEQNVRVLEVLATIKQVREETVNRLFVKDSPVIWNAWLHPNAGQNLVEDQRNSFSAQLTALRNYVRQKAERFVFHGVILILLIIGLYWARRRVQPWVEQEPSLKPVAQVFHIPIATALVLSILLNRWIYPQSPRMLSTILLASALIPAIVILRDLVERHLFPTLNALMFFYLIDQSRVVVTVLPFVARLFFLVEMLGGIAFLIWLINSTRMSQVPASERVGVWQAIMLGGRVMRVIFAIAFLANVLGYVSLSNLLSNATLGSAYMAAIFFVAIKIADGLIMFAARIEPLSLLTLITNHRPIVRQKVHRLLVWIGAILWLFSTLELFSLRLPFVEKVRQILAAKLSLGTIHISLGNVLAFCLTVWAAFLISRFLRFILEEDVYPRVHLAQGIPYAVSTMLHYIVLLLGFFFAIAALGIDMTQFTILAGAFGVGIGFGLQNIVNNFVSGLILLFERPIRVNDVIQFDGVIGVVERIGIRASVVRQWDSAEIILPNSKLISDRVTNWTFSNRVRGIEIDIGVAYGTDPQRIIGLLKQIAAANPLVAEMPAPQALFIAFGADSLNFKLRLWTSFFEKWEQLRSDIAVSINTVFEKENISIPNTQRDIHVRSIDPEIFKAVKDDTISSLLSQSRQNPAIAANPQSSEASSLNSQDTKK